MNDRIKLAIGIVGAACAAGVLADSLLRATPWGINVLLWLIPVGLAAAALARARGAERLPVSGRLAIPLVLFACMVAWRDSSTLRWLDIAAVLSLAALMAAGSRLGRLPVAGAVEIGKAIFGGLDSAILGCGWLVGQDVRWKVIAPRAVAQHGMAIGRGLILAIPLLLLFGALFDSADEVFHGLVVNALHIDAEQTSHHLLVAAVGAWIVGGFLRALLLPELPASPGDSTSEVSRPLASGEPPRLLGITELTIVLSSLTALFGLFVAIQIRYLFGGHPLVKITPHLTYADYAHKGFFELAAVAALILPLLLISDSVLRDRDMRSLRIFRTLAAVLTGLVFVIIASAYQRMWIYQFAYGWTELRFYVVAFICWLSVVFIWLLLTVLTGRRSRFTVGAFALGLAWIAGLHVMNPDNFIVRSNIAISMGWSIGSGPPFDLGYASTLSADAAEALDIRWYDAINLKIKDKDWALVKSAFERWQKPCDWRTWNWSRSRASQIAAPAIANLPAIKSPVAAQQPIYGPPTAEEANRVQ